MKVKNIMNYKCRYCGWTGPRKDFEIDHVIPIVRSILQNILQPALDLICSGCNRQKGRMTGAGYMEIAKFIRSKFRTNYLK
ncbi:HNH endonuclease [Candidatus Daviesbacteria bacterium]|nr:HNH endonuclease [Candidatus Daviesbacteria bacterium]